MDLIMESFALANVPGFTAAELADYEALLEESDPDLYNWITRKEDPPSRLIAVGVFQKLMRHKIV